MHPINHLVESERTMRRRSYIASSCLGYGRLSPRSAPSTLAAASPPRHRPCHISRATEALEAPVSIRRRCCSARARGGEFCGTTCTVGATAHQACRQLVVPLAETSGDYCEEYCFSYPFHLLTHRHSPPLPAPLTLPSHPSPLGSLQLL